MEHWNVNVQRQIGVGPRDRVRLRRIARARSDLRARRQPAGREPDSTQPPAQPAVRRYHADRVAGVIALQRAQLKYVQRLATASPASPSYTYGKSTDDASGFFTSAGDPNFPQNSLDPGAERSRSSFDVRHRFSIGLTYELPFSGNAWVKDWQVQVVATSHSGRPFTVAVHPDIDASNTGRSNLGFGYNDRPNVSGDPHLSDRTTGTRSAGSTPPRSRCRRSARSATPAATRSKARAIKQPQPRHRRNCSRSATRGCSCGSRPSTCSTRRTRSAGRVPGLADLRPDSVCRITAPDSVWGQGDLLRLRRRQ